MKTDNSMRLGRDPTAACVDRLSRHQRVLRQRSAPAYPPQAAFRVDGKAPQIVVARLIGSYSNLLNADADLLVLTKFAGGRPLGPAPNAVDVAMNGLISQRIQQEQFAGALGEQLVIERSTASDDKSQRYVVLLGLGPAADFNGWTLWRVLSQLLDRAAQLKVSSIAMPVAIRRVPGRRLNLRMVAQILKATSSESNRGLKRITVLCSAQGKRFLEAGLAA